MGYFVSQFCSALRGFKLFKAWLKNKVIFTQHLSLEPMCQRKIFIFMLCILLNNKDLFDLI